MADAPRRFARARAERTIALTRVAVAAVSLYGIWLDPAEPARFAQSTYLLHTAYVTYSVVMLGVMWRRSSTGWLPFATHVADIIIFSIFQYLTLGPSSPFFTYFIFSLFCGAVRWGWRGVAVTAPIVVIAFVVIGASMSASLGPTEFELNRFVIRAGYLVVVAVLLVYLGRHEQRLRDDISRLTDWPITVGADMATEIKRVIDHAVTLVPATHAVIVWELDEEPRAQIAAWTRQSFVLTQYRSSELDPWIADLPADASFLSAAPVIAEPVMAHLSAGPIASSAFRTERLSGRVFFSGLGDAATEILPLVEVVAREVSASIGACEMHKRAQQLAVREDRIRVARDLHDGVLQSLTGIRLELQSMAEHAPGSSASDLRSRLHAMERALAADQRELRFVIEGLQPPRAGRAGSALAARLEELTALLSGQWRTPVTLRFAGGDLSPTPELEVAVPRMIHEAVVNALQHGDPSRVTVTVHTASDGLRVVVADDGRGFPFEGQFDHATLVARNLGPASLCERVASLGGEVSVDSTASGARVEIRLPAAAHA